MVSPTPSYDRLTMARLALERGVDALGRERERERESGGWVRDASPVPLSERSSTPRSTPPTSAPTSPLANKAAISPWFSFCAEQWPFLPTGMRSNQKEALLTLGHVWKGLPEAEKARYLPRFAGTCRAPALVPALASATPYNPAPLRAPAGVVLPMKRSASPTSPPASERPDKKARGTSTNNYSEFCREHRPLLPATLRNTERERLLGQMWKALSFAGRARWEVLGGKRATGTLVSTPALSPSATRCLREDKAVDGAVRAVLAFQQASDEATMTGNEAVVVDLSDARRSGIVRLQCSIKWAPDYWILNTADGPVCIPLAPTMSS